MTKANTKTPAQQLLGDITPKLADYTDDILFGEVWESPELSKRDRSLITCAALIAMGKTQQMPTHFRLAIDNGVKQEELVEVITHLAFYAGWPAAVTASLEAKAVFADDSAT